MTISNYEDEDIWLALNWFLSYIHEEHWPGRMDQIKKAVQTKRQ